MYKFLVRIISKKIFLISEDNNSEEAAWCRYFIEVILINIIKTILIIFIALLLNTLYTTIICELVFLSIRKQADGWHANNSWYCSLLSITFLVLIPYQLVRISCIPFLFSIFLIIISLIIFNYSVYTSSKDFNFEKHFFITLLLTVYSCIIFFVQNTYITSAVLSGIFGELVLVIISIINERRDLNVNKESLPRENEFLDKKSNG
ncbi:accessory gene regulator B family protein [Enterococcus hulanensis]|uniref:accessory gene regulator B family protein n=1 Tax=Enterococcus hulanensis TaxID=2559929 RepID=UPI0035D70C4A